MLNIKQQNEIIGNIKNVLKSPLQLYVVKDEEAFNSTGFMLNYITKTLGLRSIYINPSSFDQNVKGMISYFRLKTNRVKFIYYDSDKKSVENSVMLKSPGSLVELSIIMNDLLNKERYNMILIDNIQNLLSINEAGQIINFIEYLIDKVNLRRMALFAVSKDSDSSSVLVPKLQNYFNSTTMLLF